MEEFRKFKTGDISDTLQRYETMIKSSNVAYFDVYELENIIDYYVDSYKIKDASKACRFALSIHPDSIAIKTKQAKILIEQGNPYEAIDLLESISLVEPQNEEILSLKAFAFAMIGDISQAKKAYDALLSDYQSDKAFLLYEAGYTFRNSGQYELAKNYLEKAYKYSPEDKDVIYELAFVYEKLDENIKSKDLYEKYIDIDPMSFTAWYNLGIVYRKENNKDKAVEAFDFALALDPKSYHALMNKALTFMQFGDYTTAIELFHELNNEIGKSDPKALSLIGECYANLKDFKKAEKYILKSIEIDVNNEVSPAYLYLAQLYLNTDRPHESLQILEKGRKKGIKRNGVYWYISALALIDINKPLEAIEAFRKAVDNDPLNYEYWIHYIQTVQKIGSVKEILSVFAEAYQYIDFCYKFLYFYAANLFNYHLDLFGYKLLRDALIISPKGIKIFMKYLRIPLDYQIKRLILKFSRKYFRSK